MMVVEIGYHDKAYDSSKSSPVKIQELDLPTEDDIFVEFNQLNNRLRYCNGSFYKFVLPEMQEKYIQWGKALSYGRSFELYYGNGVVD